MPRSGPQSGRGMNQDELLALVASLRTNMLALGTALDADDGVASTTYASTFTFSLPIRWTDGYVKHQGMLLEVLQNITTKWNALLAVADLDGTLDFDDYASTCAITDYVNDRTVGDLLNAGMYEGALAYWLNHAITQFNTAIAKFDADLGDTDYTGSYTITAATNVDATGARILVA